MLTEAQLIMRPPSRRLVIECLLLTRSVTIWPKDKTRALWLLEGLVALSQQRQFRPGVLRLFKG